jgi:Ca2+-binding RTX toxin-like protein
MSDPVEDALVRVVNAYLLNPDISQSEFVALLRTEAAQLDATLAPGMRYALFREAKEYAQQTAYSDASIGIANQTDAGRFLDAFQVPDTPYSDIMADIIPDPTDQRQALVGDLDSPWREVSRRFGSAAKASGNPWIFNDPPGVDPNPTETSVLYGEEITEVLSDGGPGHLNGVDTRQLFALATQIDADDPSTALLDLLGQQMRIVTADYTIPFAVLEADPAFYEKLTVEAHEAFVSFQRLGSKDLVAAFFSDESTHIQLDKLYKGVDPAALAGDVGLVVGIAEFTVSLNTLADAYRKHGLDGFKIEADKQIKLWGVGIVAAATLGLFSEGFGDAILAGLVVAAIPDVLAKIVTGEMQNSVTHFDDNAAVVFQAMQEVVYEGANNVAINLSYFFGLPFESNAPNQLTPPELPGALTVRGEAPDDEFDRSDSTSSVKMFGAAGNDKLVGGHAADALFGGAGDDVIVGGGGADYLIGDDLKSLYENNDPASGNDTISGDAGDDQIEGGLGNDVLDGGDGDDLVVGSGGNDILMGGAGQDKLKGGEGVDLIDGGSGYNYVIYDPDVNFDEAGNPVVSKGGLEVTLGRDGNYLTVSAIDRGTGKDFGADKLDFVQQIVLTSDPDHLNISTASLDADIVVDLSTSGRLQSELQPGETLDEDAFLHNVDVSDYSGVAHGLIYYNGRTAEREQGLLSQGGVTQLGGILDEIGLIARLGKVDKLHVEGAEKVILTNYDDVLVRAPYGSIVDLGTGQDKVWLQPGLLIQNFGTDDRLTLFGALNLYGGVHFAGLDSPYAVGPYGVAYGINDAGDLLVVNPWMTPGDDLDAHMYIENWAATRDPNTGIGAGDIRLTELSIGVRLLRDLPSTAHEISLWCVATLLLRDIVGSSVAGASDPLVLDLDGDGIELSWRTGGSAHFDIDNDLYAERTAWAARDDGMLARDINGNGKIDAGELFGDGDSYGLNILAALDGNHDGIVSAADNGLADFNGDGVVNASDTFGSLLVWQDRNEDRVSQSSELTTVGQRGIISFAVPANGGVTLDAHGQPQIVETINGSHVIGSTTFTRGDGSTGTAGEVLLSLDDINSHYDGAPIAITADAAALPNLKGFGTLTDLRSALSYMPDPSDADDQAAASARAEAVADLLADFNTPDLDALVSAMRGVALVWGSAAPVRDAAGDIVTGLRDLPDVPVVRVDGNVVDYIWGGTQTTETDTDGSTISIITIEFGTGAKITYRHDSDASQPAAITSWQALRDALFGGASYAIADSQAMTGSDDGTISFTRGSSWQTPSLRVDGSGHLAFTAGVTIGEISGDELAFFERYVDDPFDAFSVRPAAGSDPVHALIETLQRIEETYKQMAVAVAVQGGPLAHYFTDVRYDAAEGTFFAANPDRQLGGVFEKLITDADAASDPVHWLADWKPFMDILIGNFDRGESYLTNNNPFLLQNLVDGYESAGSTADFIAVATALGLPGDAVISGSGAVEGSNDIEFFYINGDETTVSGHTGADTYIVGDAIGHVVIDDTTALNDGGGNQVRFANHNADEFDVSRSGNDLVLTLLATGETVTVKDQFMGEWPSDMIANAWFVSGIDQIVFADGETWSDADLTREAATVDSAGTTVTGTSDTNYMWGGAGDDRLEGGGDYDIYRFDLGDGHDTIADFESNPFRIQADSIYFGQGITQQDVHFSRVGNSNDYTITYGNQGDQIIVEGAFNKIHPVFYPAFFTGAIEFLVFTDMSSISHEQIMARLIDQSSTAGNDTIYGFDNDDRIHLGAGDDWVQGGSGADTYYFGEGDGHDQIRDGSGTIFDGLDEDTLILTTPTEIEDIQFIRTGTSEDLTIRLADGSSEVTLLGQDRAVFPGSNGIYFDRVDQFKYTDMAGQEHSFDWADLQNIILDRASTDGNDQIYGFNTADVIDAGLGDDFVAGGNGGDIYHYDLGDGHDTIFDDTTAVLAAGVDIVEFGTGILPGGVRAARDPNAAADLILELADGGSIRLQGQLDYMTINFRPREVEEVYFSDGTVWTASDLRQNYLANAVTSGDDHIIGFYSDDTLYGGAGDDVLEGGDGSDTYQFGYGDGHDTIAENVAAVTYDDDDTIEFGPGIGVEDVTFSIGASHVDLIVTLNATGETLTINGQNLLIAWFTWFDVENFAFEDGTVLHKADINAKLIASQVTSGNDTVTGFWADDTMYGGAGDDLLQGAGGADNYLFGYGDGHDTIEDGLNAAFEVADHDTVRFADGILPTDVAITGTGSDRSGLEFTLTQTGETLSLSALSDIEFFTFGDGQTLTRAELLQLIADRQSTNGNDTIDGTSLDDVLAGGTGNDVLNGWAGNDTYVYTRGDGNDVFDDTQGSQYISGTDKVLLHGIATSAVIVGRSGNDIVLTIAESAPGAGDGGQITLVGTAANYAEHGIESVRLDDGTVWDKAALRQMSLTNGATPGDDVIVGTNAAETFEGGHGNDTLTGGNGDDTYVYYRGDGNDIVDEDTGYYQNGGYDTLILHGVTPSSISFDITQDRDLVLVVAENAAGAGDGGRIALKGTADSSWQRGLESVHFDDGTVWSNTDLKTHYFAGLSTPGNDTIVGYDSSADTFEAGRGDDTMSGKNGSDTYIYKRGDGNDVVDEDTGYYQNGGYDTLLLHGVTPSSISFDITADRDLVLVIAESAPGAGDGGRIALKGTADSSWQRGIESVHFDDGTVWSNADLRTHYFAGLSTPGNDTIVGFDSSADTFEAGRGDDTMSGKNGSDTYIYNRGDGNDVVDEDTGYYQNGGTADTVILHNIAPGSVTVGEGANRDLVLVISESSSGAGDAGRIELKGTADDTWDRGIEFARFDNGTVWSKSDLKAHYFEATATPGNDTILGYRSDDTIRAGGGDDSVNGGDGNDTYLYSRGDGNDVYSDTWGGADQLVLSGINSSAVTVFSNGPDITILVPESAAGAGDSGSILFRNERSDGAEQIVFADTTWTRAQLLSAVSYYAGTSGNDTITATAAADDIRAGLGDDQLSGLAGNDSYTYQLGDGNDVVDEIASGTDVDTLILHGINQADVQFERRAADMTDIVIRMLSTGQTITLDNQLDQEGGVEKIVFENGTTLGGNDWSLDGILTGLATITGTSAAETLTGTSANDKLQGLGGADIMRGNGGSDTYIFASGDGNDTIDDDVANTGDIDVLKFTDLNPSGITVGRSASDLQVVVVATGEVITISDHFRSTSERWGVEKFVFANGTEWDLAMINSQLATAGTPGNDYLSGTSGPDMFAAGRGNDMVIGGEGSDTYVYTRGDGDDIFNEATGSIYFSGSNDQVLLHGIVASSVHVERSGNDLVLVVAESSTGAGDGGRITLVGTGDDNQQNGIESVVFDDGTTWSKSQLKQSYLAWSASSGNDTIAAFNGTETLEGGHGNDTLVGGEGNDTYVYTRGDGTDTVNEATGSIYFSGWNDRVLLHNIAVSATHAERSGNDLVLVVAESSAGAGDGGRITLLGTGDDNQQNGIENVVFDDGTIWSKSQLKQSYLAWSASSGNDTITAFNGTETLEGGHGNDTLIGGEGNDTYVYTRGDGNDTVNETTGSIYFSGWSDQVLLHGITTSAVHMERSVNDLVVVVGETSTGAGDGGRITLLGTGDDNQQNGIESVVFDDGTTWSKAQLKQNYLAWSASSGNDTITAFNGTETLEGGHGNDTLIGGEGNDTYVYTRGDGDDTVDETTGSIYFSGSNDRVLVHNVAVSATHVERSGSDLILVVDESSTGAGDGGRITLSATGVDNQQNGIESVVFDDGTTRSKAQLRDGAWMLGTSGNDTITGTSTADRIIGLAGNDTLTGGGASDIFVFNVGFGKDTITDFTAGAGSVDVIQLNTSVFANFAAVTAAATQVGSDTLITYDANNTLTLKNVAMSSLHQDDFTFITG